MSENYYENMFKNNSFGLDSTNPSSFTSGLAKSLVTVPVDTEFSDFLLKDKIKKSSGLLTPSVGTNTDGNLFGFSNNQVSGFADLANVGLGIANTFTNLKNASLDRKNIKEQIAMRRESWDNFKKSRSGFNNFSA